MKTGLTPSSTGTCQHSHDFTYYCIPEGQAVLGKDTETVLKKDQVCPDFLPGGQHPCLQEVVCDEK